MTSEQEVCRSWSSLPGQLLNYATRIVHSVLFLVQCRSENASVLSKELVNGSQLSWDVFEVNSTAEYE